MRNTVKKFLGAKSGNFAVMTAMLAFPLMAGVAMMVEYTNLSDNHSRLQHAVDAAALYVGKYNLEHDKLPSTDDVQSFVVKNFEGDVSSVQILGQSKDSEEYSVVATSKAPQYFFSGLAPNVYNQSAEAMVPKGRATNLDVALVLDTTASMSVDGKLKALKTTAKDFLDDLTAVSNSNGEIRVGIVPFDHHVNVGTSNRNASWVDAPADRTRTVNQCRSKNVGGRRECSTTTYVRDGVKKTGRRCRWVGGTWTRTCSPKKVTDKWRGCVGSRSAPYTYRDTAPNARFPGLLNVRCSSEITPLTEKLSSLKSKINKLRANRDTYAAVGVMWGLRILSPEQPYTESKNADNPSRVMVLMADGDNTRSNQLAKNDPRNNGRDGVAGDKSTKAACDEAKNKGIAIYTIAFGKTISSRGQEVLKYCATTADGYFLAKDAKGLKDAFDEILAELTKLRLTG
ncbi:MAG: pilus assembly protein [Pseudomonadota bacterium]